MPQAAPLGFGTSPRAQYIYLNPKHSTYGWYMWDKENNKPLPIDESALTGTITGVSVRDLEFRNEMNRKVQLHLSAGATQYVIEAGLYTTSARTLLAALDKLERPSALRRLLRGGPAAPLVTIEARPGDEKRVFLGVIPAGQSKAIEIDYPEDEVAVDALLERALRAFPVRS